MSKELALQTEVSPLIESAVSLSVDTDEAMTAATELLSRLNTMNDRATTEKERITRPLLDALAVERGRWKPIETTLAEGIQALRSKLTAYRTEQKRIADEKADKIAARMGAGKGKLKPETAIAQIDALPTAIAPVQTDTGSVKFRTTQQFEITNLTLVPREYLLLNEVMVRAAMKAGTPIKGIRYYTEETVINSRSK